MKGWKQILPMVLILLFGVCIYTFADRGGVVKMNRPHLNIEPRINLKHSVAFNLQSGLQYQGSQLLSSQVIGNTVINDLLLTYKKGNTVYLIPYKQRILIPKYTREGGSRLVIPTK